MQCRCVPMHLRRWWLCLGCSCTHSNCGSCHSLTNSMCPPPSLPRSPVLAAPSLASLTQPLSSDRPLVVTLTIASRGSKCRFFAIPSRRGLALALACSPRPLGSACRAILALACW